MVLLWAEPTESRQWQSTKGTSVQGRIIAISEGSAKLERADGQTITVPLDAFVTEDRQFLENHFGAESAIPKSGEPQASGAATAENLPLPLGQTSGPIEAGSQSHYFVYLPKSLKEGRKAPLMFCSMGSGGRARSLGPFLKMAEIGGWIVAVSVESTNNFGYPASLESCTKAVEHIVETLPVDKARIYFSGHSGGGSQALENTTKTRAAGVMPWVTYVAAEGTPKALRYYLIGGGRDLNRYCTADMKNELGKGAVLRFHPGGHNGPTWMLQDGMFWFQGEYLTENRDKAPEEAADFEAACIAWIRELSVKEPHRAYAHALYLKETYQIRGKNAPLIEGLVTELGKNSDNVRYVSGLQVIEDFCSKKLARLAEKGNTPIGHSDPGIAEAASKLADEFAGVTVIEEVFRALAEPTI